MFQNPFVESADTHASSILGPGIGGNSDSDGNSGSEGSGVSPSLGMADVEGALGEAALGSGVQGIAAGVGSGDIGVGIGTVATGLLGSVPGIVGQGIADTLGFGQTTAANIGQSLGNFGLSTALGPLGGIIGPTIGGIAGEGIADALGARGNEAALDMAEDNFGFFGAHLGMDGMGQGTVGLGVPSGIGPTSEATVGDPSPFVPGVQGADDAEAIANALANDIGFGMGQGGGQGMSFGVPSHIGNPNDAFGSDDAEVAANLGPGIGGDGGTGAPGGAPGASPGSPGDAVGGAGMGGPGVY